MSLAFHVAADVSVRDVDGGTALVSTSDGRLIRVGEDLAGLLRALQQRGPLQPEELTSVLGERWSVATVRETLARLQQADLVGQPGAARVTTSPRRGVGRVVWRRPMSLQITLWETPSPRNPLLRTVATCTGRSGAAVAGVLALTGVFPTIGASLGAGSILSAPLPVSQYVLALVALLLTVSLHELAHAGALLRRGGQPRRLGVMLFYLSPAMFCDVSDAWRLPPRRRVEVAVAGSVVHGACGGLAGLLALLVPGDVRAAFVLYALLNYTYLLLNLVPFVKLDGYLALMGWLDLPFLRTRAMEEFHDVCTAVLFRAPRRPGLGPAWVPWFGAACSVFPLVLLGGAASRAVSALCPAGPLGAALALVVVVGVFLLLSVALARVLVDGFRRRVSGIARPVLRLLVGVAVLCSVAAFVPVRHVPVVGFARDGDAVVAAVPRGAAAPVLVDGSRLHLFSSGAVRGAEQGTAVVSGGSSPCRVPLSALVPALRYDAGTVPADCYRLRLSDGSLSASTGVAVAPPRNDPLAEWLYGTYLRAPAHALANS
ncbi:MAG: daptide biosynthesis intramembrane metalloprotease [Motilibacteraceae bacterium]